MMQSIIPVFASECLSILFMSVHNEMLGERLALALGRTPSGCPWFRPVNARDFFFVAKKNLLCGEKNRDFCRGAFAAKRRLRIAERGQKYEEENMTDLSPTALCVLAALRENREDAVETDSQGHEWRDCFLDDALAQLT